MVEDVVQLLVAAVNEHYSKPKAPPLLLSSFGQRNTQLLADLKHKFGSLKSAIQAAGFENIRFIDLTVGREAVAPAAIATELQVKLEENSATQRQSANLFASLPMAVQIAFCVRTEANEYIAIDTVRPFRFTKVTTPDLIRPTQRVIPDLYRLPGLSLRAASLHDRETLWRHFLAWAEKVTVDPALFQHGEATTALGRLIAAQPADIIPRLVIPADIAQLLLKHS